MRIRAIALLSSLLCVFAASAQSPQPAAPTTDGSHDFDFNFGVWQSHIRRLVHPLTGSGEWVELNGTVTVRKVWDGKAQLEEINADGPDGRFQGLTLFLYNPQSHQWRQIFANSSDGVLNIPAIGGFQLTTSFGKNLSHACKITSRRRVYSSRM